MINMENMYYLIDLERTVSSGQTHYWKHASRGYTEDINEAGMYPDDVSANLVRTDIDKLTVRLSAKEVYKLMNIPFKEV